MDLPDLHVLSELVRQAAREELLPRFAEVQREFKRDGSVVTVADRAMQDRLQAALHERWPAYPLLGEEMSEQEQARLARGAGTGLWVLDPLDGTSNFAAGVPFFAVSLALLVERRAVLGMVYDPARDETFSAASGLGAWLNGQALRPRRLGLPLRRALAAVDFKRLPTELATRLAAHAPYGSQRSLGSVALDWCWVAAGRFHVYIHGRQMLWDYAAGHLVLSESGGRSCTLAGEPVLEASAGPRSAVAALDPDLFATWCEALGVGC
jgi:myo-inositol-1(or 4)-monophosphatase